MSIGLFAIVAACAGRLFAGGAIMLVLSSAVAGTGVAIIQALLPGVMKARFAARLPFAMGLYSASIMAGGGLGASITPELAAHVSWQVALAVWALPALDASIVWMLLMRADALPRAHVAGGTQNDAPSLFANRRAWTLGIFFGLVNGGYTSLVAWMPAYLAARSGRQRKRHAARFGHLFGDARDRRPGLAMGLVAQLIGFCMLLLMPLAAVALLGGGLGGVFALSLVLTLDHADDHALAARLVAFVQGVGFMIAALAPVIAGVVGDVSGGFTLSWAMLAVSLVAMIALNLVFGPRDYARAMHRAGAEVPDPLLSESPGTRSIRRADRSSARPGTTGGNAYRNPLP